MRHNVYLTCGLLNKDNEQLKLALMGEHHLSPQHYELNANQHVLDRTRVSVSKRYSKATRSTSLGEVAAQNLTEARRSDPCLIDCNNNITNPVSKGREGGKNLR